MFVLWMVALFILGGFIMEVGERLKLYSGILLGSNGISMRNRFKIVRTIHKHNYVDLYQGLRADYICDNHFKFDWISRDDKDPNLIHFRDESVMKNLNVRPSIFYHEPGFKYYYDVADNNAACQLINSNSNCVNLACCNVKKIDDYNRFGRVKIKK